MPRRIDCESCRKPPALCYCHLIRQHVNEWPVRLLQHHREKGHARGTARIAQLSLNTLSTVELRDREVFAPPAEERESWCDAILLYPGEDGGAVDIASLKGSAPRPLIVVDGTWRKSKAIVLGSPYLQSLPRYSFSTEAKPRYRIRKASRADFFSTLEAIVFALSAVETGAAGYAQMLEVMDWMVDQQLRFIERSSADEAR